MSTREFHFGAAGAGTLASPADLCTSHHLNDPGAQVRIVERNAGVIERHPLASVPADHRWFWSQRWQRMEREADEDIAAGRVRAHQDVDDLLVALDR